MTTPKRNEAVALPVYVATAPERIYLQVADDEYYADNPFPRTSDVSWCSDSVLALEVKYVRADIHDALQGEVSRLREVVGGWVSIVAAHERQLTTLRGVLSDTAENLRRMANDEFADCEQVRLEAVLERIETNLEPPTDGR